MSAFTKREVADSLYATAKSINAGVVGGASPDMMSEITASRLQHVDAAIAAIDAAKGTQKILLKEPTDEKLAQMRDDLVQHRQHIAAVLIPTRTHHAPDR